MVLRKDIIGLLLVIFAEVARAFSIPFWKRQIASDTNIAEKALFFLKGVFKPKGHKESPTVVHNNANSVVHPTQLRSHKFQTAHQNRINHLPVYPLKVTNNIDHTKIDIEELAIGLDTDESFLERESDTVHDEITCPITNSAAFVPFQLTRRKVTEQGGKISSDDAALELSDVNVDVAVSTIETDQCRIVPVSTEEFYDSVASTLFLHSFANQLNDKTAADTRSLNPLMWMMSQHSGVDLSAAPDLSNTIFVSEPNGNNSTATYIPEPILSLSQPLSQSTGQVSISKSTVDLSYLALFCFLLGVVSTYVSGRAISTFRTWYANRMPRFIAQLEKRAIQLLNTGQYEQVKALLSKEVPRIAQYRGALHVDTAAFRHFLGKALLALKECGPAEQQLVQVVEAYELFGEDLYMAHALEDLALSQQTILAPEVTSHSLREESMHRNSIALQTMLRALRIFTEDALAAEITPSRLFTTSSPLSLSVGSASSASASPCSSSGGSGSSRSESEAGVYNKHSGRSSRSGRSTEWSRSSSSAGSCTTRATHSSLGALSANTNTSMTDLDSVRRSPRHTAAVQGSSCKRGGSKKLTSPLLHSGKAGESQPAVCTPRRGSPSIFHKVVHLDYEASSVDSDNNSSTASASTDTTIGEGLNLSRISEGSGELERDGDQEGLGSPFCDRRNSYGNKENINSNSNNNSMGYDDLFSPSSSKMMTSPAVPSVANPMLSASKPNNKPNSNNSGTYTLSFSPIKNTYTGEASPLASPVPKKAPISKPETGTLRKDGKCQEELIELEQKQAAVDEPQQSPVVERDHELRDALEDLERLLMQPSVATSVLLGGGSCNTSLCLDAFCSSAHGSPPKRAQSATKSVTRHNYTPARERLHHTYCSQVNFSCTPEGGNISSLLRPVLECPCNVHVARVQHRVALLLQALDRLENALEYLYACRDIYIALNRESADSEQVKSIEQEIQDLRRRLCLPGEESLLFSPSIGYRQADMSESWEEVVEFNISPRSAVYHNLDSSFLTALNETK